MKLHWIILPASPDDIHDIIARHKELREEDIQMYYQENLKQRKLREIVEELQIEEDSEIGNINNYILGKKDVPTSGGIINSFTSNS